MDGGLPRCLCGNLPAAAVGRKPGRFFNKPFLRCAASGCKFFQPTTQAIYTAVVKAGRPGQGGTGPLREVVTLSLASGEDRVVFLVAEVSARHAAHDAVFQTFGAQPYAVRTVGGRASTTNVTRHRFDLSKYSELRAALGAVTAPPTDVVPVPEAALASVAHTAELRAKLAAGVPFDDNGLFADLHPFQREGVAFAVALGGRVLIADEMGLGKTVQAIATAHHFRHDGPVLVVCPASLMCNWQNEFHRWWRIPHARCSLVRGRKAHASPEGTAVTIVNYNCLAAVEGQQFATVLVDESHQVKNPTSQRTQKLQGLCRAAAHVVLLSGTPAEARPVELHSQLEMVRREFPGRTEFGKRYCAGFVGGFGWDFSGVSHVEELQVVLAGLMVRRRKKDVLQQLPDKDRQLLYLQVTDSERKAMSGALEDATKQKKMLDTLARASGPCLELYSRTYKAKIPAVKEYLTDLLANDEAKAKLLVFAHHLEMLQAIEDAVKAADPADPIDYIRIDGGTDPVLRESLTQHFQAAPKCRVAVLSIKAAGTGLNFTSASQVVFAELVWSPGDHLQCEDRIHRMGQGKLCTVRYLLAHGTIDELLWPRLEEKLAVTQAVLEDTALGDEVNLVSRGDAQTVGRQGEPAPPVPEPVTGPMDRFVVKAPAAPVQAPTTVASAPSATAEDPDVTIVDEDDVQVLPPRPSAPVSVPVKRVQAKITRFVPIGAPARPSSAPASPAAVVPAPQPTAQAAVRAEPIPTVAPAAAPPLPAAAPAAPFAPPVMPAPAASAAALAPPAAEPVGPSGPVAATPVDLASVSRVFQRVKPTITRFVPAAKRPREDDRPHTQ